MAFLDDVVVRQADDVSFELVEPLRYQGNTDTFTVPVGFVTDFASVPRAFVWLLPRYGAYTQAAILHDWLVEHTAVSRRDADGLFRRAMWELAVPIPRRWSMWAAVRLASGMSQATAKEWAQFLAISLVALPFVAIPAVLVQIWLIMYWIIEGLIWVIGRSVGKPTAEPVSPART